MNTVIIQLEYRIQKYYRIPVTIQLEYVRKRI